MHYAKCCGSSAYKSLGQLFQNLNVERLLARCDTIPWVSQHPYVFSHRLVCDWMHTMLRKDDFL